MSVRQACRRYDVSDVTLYRRVREGKLEPARPWTGRKSGELMLLESQLRELFNPRTPVRIPPGLMTLREAAETFGLNVPSLRGLLRSGRIGERGRSRTTHSRGELSILVARDDLRRLMPDPVPPGLVTVEEAAQACGRRKAEIWAMMRRGILRDHGRALDPAGHNIHRLVSLEELQQVVRNEGSRDLTTVMEAARIINQKPANIRNWIQKGIIRNHHPPDALGEDRTILVSPDELREITPPEVPEGLITMRDAARRYGMGVGLLRSRIAQGGLREMGHARRSPEGAFQALLDEEEVKEMAKPVTGPGEITLPQAAREYGLSPWELRKLVRAGKLRVCGMAMAFGSHRESMVLSRQEIRAVMQQDPELGKHPASPGNPPEGLEEGQITIQQVIRKYGVKISTIRYKIRTGRIRRLGTTTGPGRGQVVLWESEVREELGTNVPHGLITIREAARNHGMTVETIHSWVQRGQLRAYGQAGNTGPGLTRVSMLISEQEIREMMGPEAIPEGLITIREALLEYPLSRSAIDLRLRRGVLRRYGKARNGNILLSRKELDGMPGRSSREIRRTTAEDEGKEETEI